MHDDRFDAMTQALWQGKTRRRVLRRLAMLPLVSAFAALLTDLQVTGAELPVRRIQRRAHRHRQHRRRRHHPGRSKRNDKRNDNDQRQDGAQGGAPFCLGKNSCDDIFHPQYCQADDANRKCFCVLTVNGDPFCAVFYSDAGTSCPVGGCPDGQTCIDTSGCTGKPGRKACAQACGRPR